MSFFSAHKKISLRNRAARKLICEGLEQRQLMTSYIVDTLDDVIAEDGKISLREAILASNLNTAVMDAPAGEPAATAVDSIAFAASLAGQTITFVDRKALKISEAISIDNTHTEPITINPNLNSRAIRLTSEATNVTINGLRVTNGRSGRGGAIYVSEGASLTLNDMIIEQNNAGNGGAIYNENGSVAILNSMITNNVARGPTGSGGAIYSASGSITIENSQITSNQARRAGGAIEIDVGTLQLTNTDLLNNDVNGLVGPAVPGNGGAIHVSGSATVDIQGGSITGNVAASEGGGIWNQAGTTMTLTDVLVSNNSALGDLATNGGGGIFNNGGTVNLLGVDTLVTANRAMGDNGSGGGIFNHGNGVLNVMEATINRNIANRAGGGIESTAGTTNTLTNVILASNRAGVGVGAVAAPGSGGGLHVSGNADVTINGGRIYRNIAAKNGGGVWNDDGTLSITNAEVSDNRTRGAEAADGGGGIYNSSGTVVLTNVNLLNNKAKGASGSGGGLLSAAVTVTVIDSDFTTNSAIRAGGGIEVVAGNLTINNSTLVGNDVDGVVGRASPGNGGGIHVTGAAIVAVNDTRIEDNKAANEGGGVWNSATGNIVFQRSTIDGNTAAFGGGVFSDGSGGVTWLQSSTVSRNTATNNGGGLMSEGGDVTFLNSTVSTNTAVDGAGIHLLGGQLYLTSATVAFNTATGTGGGANALGGSLVGKNSIVSNNIAVTNPDISGTLSSNGHNLISNTAGVTIINTVTGNQLNVDPLLGVLQINGGGTETHALLAGSSAINAGTNEVTSVDQRGTTRDDQFDIGAYEVQTATAALFANFEDLESLS